MSRKEKLLAGTADANFDLDDLIQILQRLDFTERQGSGSHRIFSLEGIEGIINLQKTKDGKAKPYQVKQVRNFITDHKLIGDEQI